MLLVRCIILPFLHSLHESMVMYGDIKKERVSNPRHASFFLVRRKWSLGRNCWLISVRLSRAAITTEPDGRPRERPLLTLSYAR